jgi:hypothetical protein
VLVVMLVGSACADDTPATTIVFGDGTTTTSTGGTDSPSTTTTSGVDTTETAPVTSSGDTSTGETTGDTDTTTGGEQALPGRSMSQLVGAGVRSTSASYVLVSTFGQPSQLQSTHESASYRLQGGLVGANGSPP